MGFEVLRRDVKTDLADLAERGRVRRADQLSAATGQRFHATAVPQYFTGDLDARLVLVHLNPKQDLAHVAPSAYSGPVPCAEEYLDQCIHFGRDKYGPNSGRTHKSPFDYRQIRYLRPFNVIDFVGDDVSDARWINLERVVDRKLQLELIPYQSVQFSTHGMTPAVLNEHFDRLLDTITAVPRAYVIFCGSVFSGVLQPGWVRREHRFRLAKNDGRLTATMYRFANLVITHGGQEVIAGWAPSYPQQGIPMDAYGSECAARYHSA
ncbi:MULTISPECIES: hypothetical protein [unclassified Micromonospora]|uniref:hypothetical protein n=1 Tax=unclassified Micromonospora TaxID=2617518 RepID=UPI002FF03C6E